MNTSYPVDLFARIVILLLRVIFLAHVSTASISFLSFKKSSIH